MAGRASLVSPISEDEQWRVTAYLIAFTPDLQKSQSSRRAEQIEKESTSVALDAAESLLTDPDFPGLPPDENVPKFDRDIAQALFEKKCNQCHDLETVTSHSFPDISEAENVIQRMISNGLTANKDELATLLKYLQTAFVKPQP